jgi:hypothetical protein
MDTSRVDGVNTVEQPQSYQEPVNNNTTANEVKTETPVIENAGFKLNGLNISADQFRLQLNDRFNRVQAQPVPTTPEAAVEKVKQTFESQGPEGAAKELAAQLRNGDAAYRENVIAQLSKEREFAGIINAAGGENDDLKNGVSAADRNLIARSFGSAFDNGKISAETVKGLVDYNAGPMQNLPLTTGTFKNEYTANLIANSGSEKLKQEFVNATFKHVQETGSDEHFLRGAARVMATDTDVLQKTLADIKNGVYGDKINLDKLVDSISRDPIGGLADFSPDKTSALVRLVDAAAKLPQGDEKIDLLKAVAKSEDATQNTKGGADALIRLFNSDSQFFSDYFTDETAIDRNQRLKDFSKFFQNTLFNDQATNKDLLIDNVTKVADDYKKNGDLYHLGALVGSAENGFGAAVKANEDRKKATKDFLDFVVGLTPLPDSLKGVLGKVLGSLPKTVADGLSSKASDKAKEAALDWLTDKLTKDTKFLFVKTGQEIKSRDDLDAILRGVLGISSLPDPNPATPRDNEAIEKFEAGLTFARDAVRD